MKKEWKIFGWLAGIFLVAYFLPLGNPKVSNAIYEAFRLLQWYARQHTLACVVPAMFIAGAIATFLSQASVMRYLGPRSNRLLAYTVASVSGCILAVCSCSVLPMFAGIYTMGAGLGPASAFLYSGPAINVMAIFLSARVLGFEIGLARAVFSIGFAFVIGLIMAAVFRHSETKRAELAMAMPEPPKSARSLLKTVLFFVGMILFLVFSDWYNTNDVTISMNEGSHITANIRYTTKDALDIQEYNPQGQLKPEVRRLNQADIADINPVPSFTMTVHHFKWHLAGLMGVAVLLMTWKWFSRDEIKDWMQSTWDFAKMIVPLLFGGVFITGFIGALMPEKYVAGLVGGNSVFSNLVASVIGAMWYFATLTEIPITETLMRLGMGKGPALALLLAGPVLSLPSMLVIYKIIGFKKTAVFISLVVVVSTITGLIFGAWVK
ncbi:MAG: permease [Verrucomicrobia bacterium]|nr:permease [Verrucomicrobiota bacterium]MBU1735602.1 permease [Verrucomicrobiota bacterium]MBU1855866.1 permease [Verrucomicrobiota bacterium]